MPNQTFSEELYDDTALKEAVDRMANLIKTHATKSFVNSEVEKKQDKLTFDTEPTAESTKPVTSGGVKTALDAKQDTLIFDTKPTAESTKPVTSGGVYEAVSELKENLSDNVYDSADVTDFIQGAYGRDGKYDASAKTLVTSDYLPTGFRKLVLDDGFTGVLFAWDSNDVYFGASYKENMLSGGYFGTPWYFTSEFDMDYYNKSYPDLKYKISIKRTSGEKLTPDQIIGHAHLVNDISASKDYVTNIISGINFTPNFGLKHIDGRITIGHRGGWAAFPENTSIGIIEGVRRGMAYIESDVAYTSDNVPVMIHDRTINRVARNSDGSEISSTIYIADITYAQANEYDWGIYKGSQFAGTKLLTFEEYIALCKNLSVVPIIELKRESGNDPDIHTQSRINNLVSIVKQYAMENNVAWISFDFASLKRVQNVVKNACYGLSIIQNQANNANQLYLRIGEINSFKNTGNYAFATISTGTISENLLSTLKENEIPFVLYFIDTAETAVALKNYPMCIGGMTNYAIDISESIKNNIIGS